MKSKTYITETDEYTNMVHNIENRADLQDITSFDYVFIIIEDDIRLPGYMLPLDESFKGCISGKDNKITIQNGRLFDGYISEVSRIENIQFQLEENARVVDKNYGVLENVKFSGEADPFNDNHGTTIP